MKQTATLLLILCCFTLTLRAQQTALPYADDFETGAPGWASVDDGICGTSWELGTPTFGFTIGAHSGLNCWDVNLNTAYTNNAVCYLISPVFDFSQVPMAYISFWTKYNAEYLWDYMSVQYSVDKGDTWSYMPFPNLIDPDGYVPRWIQSTLAVSDLYGFASVQFRFEFISDGNIIYDGYSVDDFRIDLDPLSAPQVHPDNASFSFYPNPSRGNVNFNFPDKSTSASIVIYDVTGKTVMSQQLAELSSNNMHFSQLKKGTYSVVYSDVDVVMAKKLVVVE
jgi:Secretion system C-terminal sorting domain